MDLRYEVTDNKYFNIKELVRNEFSVSSRLYTKLKNYNHIYLNKSNQFFDDTLHIGDIVEIELGFDEESENIVPNKMSLDILYEDKYLLILNKPAKLAVHPSIRHFDDTLSNGVKYYFESISLKRKIRIVNRLDKDTSGIVIFAKNEYVQETLISQMKNNVFRKEYVAILDGILDEKKRNYRCSNC